MSLQLLGLLQTSMLDYPGRVAATLFTMGCPLRCPYCHNPELIQGKTPDNFVPREQVMQHLVRRRQLLQGVAITGGEPLLHQDLPNLIDEINSLGYPVKLDTSGVLFAALQALLQLQADVSPDAGLQYVAMDVKTLPSLYGRVLPASSEQKKQDLEASVQSSMEALRQWRDAAGGRRVEFRTTVVPQILSPQELQELAGIFQPGDTWTLTQFMPGGCFQPEYNALRPYEIDVLQAAAAAVAPGVQVQLRGAGA